MVNIFNSNFEQIRPVLLNDEYWDVCLADSGTLNGLIAGNLIFSWDHNHELGNNCIVSKEDCIWPGAITDPDYAINDRGFTAVDDGTFLFDRYAITEEEFFELYTGTTYYPGFSDRFFLCPVSGNTQKYIYPYENTGSDIFLNGGFYQGVFKTEDCKYQVLPDKLDDDLYFLFKITPLEVEHPEGYIINDDFVDNTGMFFYIGTKSTNKWSVIYNSEDEDFIKKLGGDLTTSKGYPLSAITVNSFSSDNKFLTYDRTRSGFQAPDSGSTIDFYYEYKEYRDNAHLLFNRTPNGTTVSSIEKDDTIFAPRYYDDQTDLSRNAFGLQITPAGAIKYKYLVTNCDTGELEVKYGQTKPGVIQTNVMNSIALRLRPVGAEEMKIYIYANGNLLYISEILPRLNLRPLHDQYDKQAMIPFCISLGGGVQGLLDTLYANYTEDVVHEPNILEKTFAGTFIGKIDQFDIYQGTTEFEIIKE